MIADQGLLVCFGIRCDEKVEDGGEKEAELVTMVGETNKIVGLIDVKSDLEIKEGASQV